MGRPSYTDGAVTQCAKGHDLRAPGAVYTLQDGKNRCAQCQREYIKRWKQRHPRYKLKPKPKAAQPVEPSDTERTRQILALSVERETAAPWEREGLTARIEALRA